MLDPLLRCLRQRAALLGLVGIGAGIATLATGQTAQDPKELAELLGASSHSFVRSDDLRWEPSHGVLNDLIGGRFILFLGSAETDGPRDVYRAKVRLTPEGRPLEISSVYNLTSTPLGDDHALVVREDHAAYATWSFGKEQGVTVLDLAGEPSTLTKLSDRAMAWVTNLQQTGAGAGIGRVDVTFEQPGQRVGLALHEDVLAIDVADEKLLHRGRLDLKKGELDDSSAMHADAGKHLPKRLVHWAVDTVRAVSWIGPAPIAWLEEKTFALRDTVKQTLFKVRKGDEQLAKEADGPAPAAILDTSQASLDLGHWPPASIRSMWKTPDPGEGEWTVPKQSWVKHLPAVNGETPPSAFYETFVRPDEERPYAKVLMVAMDMRQLDVGIEAGSEDPKPLTGPPGTGRIPRDPKIYQRVAAAFNGGFKTEHGNYGMMLNKRVLLPAQPSVATVILTKDHRVGMGSWGTSNNIHDVPWADILSYRQNLDPLVDNDKVNPQNRGQWGFVLPGTSMQTERSGICVTQAGHMLYVWGDDTSATSLGKAMKMAGCIYGMHLDMNPHHTGFLYTNINEFKGKQYKSELLTKEMEIDTDRYLLYAPKDFFFIMLHDPKPDAVGTLDVAWEADPGAQPAPSWMPGLWRGKSGGVELVTIEAGRAAFRARAGSKEPDRHGKPLVGARGDLDADDAHRVLFALTLGTSDTKHLRGLGVEGQMAVPMSNDAHMAALSVSDEGAISITSSGTVPPKGDIVELPLLLEEGAVVGHPSSRSPALGITAAGRVLIARNGSPEELAKALKDAGCQRAVLLDRGAGARGEMFRAGTPTPPRASYDDTTLYAMSRPLLPRGFRFEPTDPVPPPAPPKKK